MINPNDAAFPMGVIYRGMTKREYFAACAMQGILSDFESIGSAVSVAKQQNMASSAQGIAALACCYADALILELSKEVKP